MSNDKLIKNMDPKIWRQLIIWCQQQGIPTAGRNAQTGAIVSEIIRQHITGDLTDTKTRLEDLKDILDRNVIPKRSYWAPPHFIEAIISRTMNNITSPNLIRNYAKMSGYEYDRRRRMYKVPIRATPASQARLDDKERIGPEEEKILEATMKHAEQVLAKRADSVSSTTPDQGAGPGSSPGPRTPLKFPRPKLPEGSKPGDIHFTEDGVNLKKLPPGKEGKTLTTKAAGRKSGNVRAAAHPNHPMPSCPVCGFPVHTRQSSVERRGKTYHEDCYDEKGEVKA